MKKMGAFLACIIFFAPGSYAADCITSFDESCLSRQYKTGEIEAQQDQRAKELEEYRKTAEKEEAQELKEEAQQAAEEIKEARHQEQLEAQRRIEDAIRSQQPPEVIVNVPAPTVTVTAPPPVLLLH